MDNYNRCPYESRHGYDGRDQHGSPGYHQDNGGANAMAAGQFDPWAPRGLNGPGEFPLYRDERYRMNMEERNYPFQSYGYGNSGFHVSGTAPWTSEWRT